MNQKGFTSIVVLILLIFVSALFLGAGALVELSLRQLRRGEDQDRELRLLRDKAGQVVELLLDDPTPFADSPGDPVWAGLGVLSGQEMQVTLRDLSSRIGPNWIRKEPLESLELLRPERSPRELQQLREDTGLHLDLQVAFPEFFREGVLETLCTPYGYFNLNVSDEFVLRRVHYLRGGDLAAAEAFHVRVQEARSAGRIIDSDSLEEFMGESYPLLFPLVNAEPVMNVYFVPERILEGLCRHYGVPVARAERILAERRMGEWTPADLDGILGVGSGAGEGSGAGAASGGGAATLRQYLGLTTWFWEIRASTGARELTWIVARVPGTVAPEYRLVEERISP